MSGNYEIPQKLSTITLLAVTSKPGSVTLNGKTVSNVTYKAETDEVIVGGLAGNLNEAWELKW